MTVRALLRMSSLGRQPFVFRSSSLSWWTVPSFFLQHTAPELSRGFAAASVKEHAQAAWQALHTAVRQSSAKHVSNAERIARNAGSPKQGGHKRNKVSEFESLRCMLGESCSLAAACSGRCMTCWTEHLTFQGTGTSDRAARWHASMACLIHAPCSICHALTGRGIWRKALAWPDLEMQILTEWLSWSAWPSSGCTLRIQYVMWLPAPGHDRRQPLSGPAADIPGTPKIVCHTFAGPQAHHTRPAAASGTISHCRPANIPALSSAYTTFWSHSAGSHDPATWQPQPQRIIMVM